MRRWPDVERHLKRAIGVERVLLLESFVITVRLRNRGVRVDAPRRAVRAGFGGDPDHTVRQEYGMAYGAAVAAGSIDYLRGHLAYVQQKAWLFSGTIAENLRYSNKNATNEELMHAADVAQAGDFIRSLKHGLDSYVAQGGTNFSGGQKQRLSIARALVKKPELYIFDDSFSALDFKTDAALRKALAKETKDAAVLIVAQRVSTIQHADQIIVLSDGGMAGIGKHDELLENCAVYREIYESQTKEAQEA